MFIAVLSSDMNQTGESFDALICVANGQMPRAALISDTHSQIEADLEITGIDNSKPFYVN